MNEDKDLNELNELKDEDVNESPKETIDLEEPEDSLSQEREDLDDDVKIKAKSTGHLSLEEFVAKGGRPEDYKSEKEYVLTGEIIELKKAIQRRDRDIDEILKYNQNVIEQQKQNFKRQLEARLQEAKELGNVDDVQQLTQEKLRVELEEQRQAQTQSANAQIEALNKFTARNATWFNNQHPEFITRCQELENIYRPSCKTWDEVADKVEKQMRYELSQDTRYKHLIDIQTTHTSSPNISASRSNVNKSSTAISSDDSVLYHKLSSNEKAMYNILKRNAKRIGSDYSVKEFLNKAKRDEEI